MQAEGLVAVAQAELQRGLMFRPAQPLSDIRPTDASLDCVRNIMYNLAMKTYSVSQARENFADILDAVEQGEDVTVTKHGVAVATITRPGKAKKAAVLPPGFLHAQGWSVTVADDFNAIPEGFEDYV